MIAKLLYCLYFSHLLFFLWNLCISSSTAKFLLPSLFLPHQQLSLVLLLFCSFCSSLTIASSFLILFLFNRICNYSSFYTVFLSPTFCSLLCWLIGLKYTALGNKACITLICFKAYFKRPQVVSNNLMQAA